MRIGAISPFFKGATQFSFIFDLGLRVSFIAVGAVAGVGPGVAGGLWSTIKVLQD